MNIERFDALSHSVASERTRRGVVRALIGVAAGGVIPARAELTSAGKKRKKPCGPCRRKQKGRCRGAKPDGTPCGECGACLDGVCTPSAKVDCGGLCTACDATVRCRTAPDGTLCLGTGTCVNGLCNKPV